MPPRSTYNRAFTISRNGYFRGRPRGSRAARRSGCSRSHWASLRSSDRAFSSSCPPRPASSAPLISTHSERSEAATLEKIRELELVDTKTPRGKPYSPSTVATDFSRFHTAIRYCKTEYPELWGTLIDPLEGIVVQRSGEPVPEVTPDQARRLIRAFREGLPQSWRVLATTVFAAESGRRVGAIGANRHEARADALCASDFQQENGRWTVTWRAAAAKGQNYGRGDDTLTATYTMVVIYRWLRRYHPNPLGSNAPLIWSPKDPSRPVSYTSINSTFKRTWQRTFGAPAPTGLAFHGFCRSVITTLATELTVLAAAAYSGRSVGTATKYLRLRGSMWRRRPT
jgi:hypothetical protein